MKCHVSYPSEAFKQIKKELEEPVQLEAKHNDGIFHPSHYSWLKEVCGVEAIDIARHLSFNLGNVVKYVIRNGHKPESGLSTLQVAIKDLKKARFYLNDEIDKLESKLNEENSNKPDSTN